MDQILTLSALVAAYVGVFRGFGLLPGKYLPLVAVGIAAIFILVPDPFQSKIVLISSIGLSAAGVYHMATTTPKNGGNGQ